jgi:tripartite-type tricarboxylate transporter receptor subunit TctC
VPAQAQSYPTKPVSIITASAAGSGPDVIGRIVAEKLSQIWSQQVLMVNRPGAGGAIAGQAAASAERDGHTLYLAISSTFIVLPVTQPRLPFDLRRDFVPIGLVGEQPRVVAASPALGVNTLAEMVALAKKRPGELSYTASNRGTIPHLAGELLQKRAGFEMTFVPYLGVAKGLHDVLGGRVAVAVESLSGLAGAIEGKLLKPLAVTSERRLGRLPEVPAVAETLPGFHASGWFALMAPAGTPEAIVQKVSDDLRKALENPELRRRIEAIGTYARPMPRAETAEFIAREQELWQPVVRGIGLAPK